MKTRVRITGGEKAIAGINRAIAKEQSVNMAGIMSVGLLIERRAAEKVPVHFGKLRASKYTRKMAERRTAVEVGFSAAYALYVHENIEMVLRGQPRRDGIGVYWGPSGEALFLTKAVRETRKDVPAVMRSARGKKK